MKKKIQELIQLGPIPLDEEMSDELFKTYDDLLQMEGPLTLEEAELIIDFFSEDCHDLNWGLLHAIESVLGHAKCTIGEYRKLIDRCRQNEFHEILRIRLENSENNEDIMERNLKGR